jgi:hypothetical protein
MKNRYSFICIFLALLLALVTVYFIIERVDTETSCTCPASDWKMGSIFEVIEWQNATHTGGSCSADSLNFGCEIAYYIFPIDVAIASLVFLLIGIVLRRKKSSTVNNRP